MQAAASAALLLGLTGFGGEVAAQTTDLLLVLFLPSILRRIRPQSWPLRRGARFWSGNRQEQIRPSRFQNPLSACPLSNRLRPEFRVVKRNKLGI